MNIDNHVGAFGECDERVVHVDVALEPPFLHDVYKHPGCSQPRKNPSISARMQGTHRAEPVMDAETFRLGSRLDRRCVTENVASNC